MPTMSVARTRKTSDRPAFEAAARQVMLKIQKALADLIAAIPSAQVSKAADLQKALGLDPKLGWRVFRVANAENALAAGSEVPSRVSMERLFKAAGKRGVPATVVKRASTAFEEFERLVAEHAGDRAIFSTMVTNVAGRSGELIDVSTRRDAFRINSQMWGVQVKTQLVCVLYHPGSNSSVIDSASIRGLRDIRRLRTDVPFRLAGHRVLDTHKHITRIHAIDDESHVAGGLEGPTLLRDYCTQPCPELDTFLEGDYVATDLRETPLGNAGAQTLFFANVIRGIEWRTANEAPEDLQDNFANLKPTQILVYDTLIHRGMWGALAPKAKVFGSLHRLGSVNPDDFSPKEMLPIHAEVQSLGSGLDALTTPHVPRYAEMVESVCHRIPGAGWDPEAFEVFRCIIEYPMLSSVLSVRFALPEKGNW